MDYKRFYKTIFAPLTTSIGPIDANTLFAIMGFDVGGPLNFSTIGAERGASTITYVSCELAVREEQKPTKHGGYRYELLASCDDEKWVRHVLTSLGHMSLNVAFDQGHTVDIGFIANPQNVKNGIEAPIQGVLFHEECIAEYEGKRYGVLRCIGITRREMELAQLKGSAVLVSRLKEAGIWPNTMVTRKSIV